jgi:two-component system sensor histidine kinase/response regulator
MLGLSTVHHHSANCTQPARREPAPRAAQSPLGHVLVVDDDPTNRRVLQGMLSQLGYSCTTVDDGAQAVEAVAQGQFDAVLMDCLMPVMDGYAAARAIRENERGLTTSVGGRMPVIAVTTLAMQGTRDRCLDAGMDDYLTKPVMLESLKTMLGRWIGGEQADGARRAGAGAPVPAADSPTDGAADALIDEAILNDLRALGDEAGSDLIAELVQNFGVEVPARFPRMRAAVAASDLSSLLQELHFVAGCAAIVGARHVEQIARSVNAKNLPASMETAAALVSQLETAFASAFARLTTLAATPLS